MDQNQRWGLPHPLGCFARLRIFSFSSAIPIVGASFSAFLASPRCRRPRILRELFELLGTPHEAGWYSFFPFFLNDLRRKSNYVINLHSSVCFNSSIDTEPISAFLKKSKFRRPAPGDFLSTSPLLLPNFRIQNEPDRIIKDLDIVENRHIE